MKTVSFLIAEIMRRVLSYALSQLCEASTWRGMVMIATGAGIYISPEQIAAISACGLGVAGLIGAFLPDRFRRWLKDGT